MCGIAGVYLRDPNARGDLDGMLTTMLDAIEHRGGDATGFIALGDEGITEWQKAACGASDFCKYRRPVPKGTRTILAHTRWATLGLPAFVENNHPLKRGAFVAIHNGHVSNHHKLFELAERTPYGQVDSESIPALFAHHGSLAAAPKVMRSIEGSAAIAVVDERSPGELLLAKGYQSPLFVLQTKRYVLWASTQGTIIDAYTKHIGALPRKAKIASLSPGTGIHFVDGKATKIKFKAYSPPKVVKTYSQQAWQDTSTEWKPTTSALGSSEWTTSKWTDYDTVGCDVCGVEKAWNSMNYIEDSEGYTLMLCNSCNSWWSEGDNGVVRDDIVSDESAVVSRILLEAGDSE